MHYIIYHPPRFFSVIGQHIVYHDKFGNNEDPYLWNDKFLHSFCHITQISPAIGSHIFWVSGDSYPNFESLFCDCVFVVNEKIVWNNPNKIEPDDSLVDTPQAFKHHYSWVNPPHSQHVFKNRKRYTLKSDIHKSFQPQDENKNLIDIVPLLLQSGISLNDLRNAISRTNSGKRAINSRPFKLQEEVAFSLFENLSKADIKVTGSMIKNSHPNA
jgi:hypothetical protein